MPQKKKVKKLTDSELNNRMSDEILGTRVTLLMQFAASLDLERLKEARDSMAENIDTYNAAGALLDPNNYSHKIKDARARFKRMDAMVKFIETLWDTQAELDKADLEKKTAEKTAKQIQSILGF